MSKVMRAVILALVLTVSALGAARANPVSAILWVSHLHLLFGNLIIGIAESCLLWWRYRTEGSTSVVLMIGANYASAWLGLLAVGHGFGRAMDTLWNEKPPPIGSTLGWEIPLLTGLFALAVLVEWPFCYLIMRASGPSKGSVAVRSLKASVLLQSASYAVLLPLYIALRVWESGW